MKAEHTPVTPIDWKNIAGLRAVLVYAYLRIDDEILWDIIQNKLENLKYAILKMSD
ncbi:MAG: DUF86 domain-containing protein [Methanogenium sp.]|nr:DUF86 domain-containing protein [Methanogenium sp.]